MLLKTVACWVTNIAVTSWKLNFTTRYIFIYIYTPSQLQRKLWFNMNYISWDNQIYNIVRNIDDKMLRNKRKKERYLLFCNNICSSMVSLSVDLWEILCFHLIKRSSECFYDLQIDGLSSFLSARECAHSKAIFK